MLLNGNIEHTEFRNTECQALASNVYHRSVWCLCNVKHSSMRSFLPLDLKQATKLEIIHKIKYVICEVKFQNNKHGNSRLEFLFIFWSASRLEFGWPFMIMDRIYFMTNYLHVCVEAIMRELQMHTAAPIISLSSLSSTPQRRGSLKLTCKDKL